LTQIILIGVRTNYPAAMSTYRIARVAQGFLATESSVDGREVICQFRTEAVAQVWVVHRATMANWADLAEWLKPRREPST
jgi:hypothetical protein